jgi:hypothetical protein
MRVFGVIGLSLTVGVLLAGISNAVLVALLPPSLRGAPTLWATTALIVTVTTAALWLLLVRRKE